MSSTFYGLIHSFVLGTLVNDGDSFCPALYFRRVIHYLHTSLVVKKIKNFGNYMASLVFVYFYDRKLQIRAMITTTC